MKGWKEGAMMTWTNGGSAVLKDAVVAVGATIGCASTDIAAGATGELRMTEVQIVPKVTTAVITQGMKLLWDSSAGLFDVGTATPAAGDIAGVVYAVEAAGNGTTTVKASFGNRIGTVT